MVCTGAVLTDCYDETNPMRQAYIDYLRGEYRCRPSWDPLTAFIAVRGAAAAHMFHCEPDRRNEYGDLVRGTLLDHCPGINNVDEHGFQWVNSSYGPSNQSYIRIDRWDAEDSGDAVDQLFCQVPHTHQVPQAPPVPPQAPPPP